jgi:hypothetical protein
MNHDKKEEITSGSKIFDSAKRLPRKLSEEQVKYFLSNQDWY